MNHSSLHVPHLVFGMNNPVLGMNHQVFGMNNPVFGMNHPVFGVFVRALCVLNQSVCCCCYVHSRSLLIWVQARRRHGGEIIRMSHWIPLPFSSCATDFARTLVCVCVCLSVRVSVLA
eukprot:scpid16340/ scgid29385/ 